MLINLRILKPQKISLTSSPCNRGYHALAPDSTCMHSLDILKLRTITAAHVTPAFYSIFYSRIIRDEIRRLFCRIRSLFRIINLRHHRIRIKPITAYVESPAHRCTSPAQSQGSPTTRRASSCRSA